MKKIVVISIICLSAISCSRKENGIKEAFLNQKLGGSLSFGDLYKDKKVDVTLEPNQYKNYVHVTVHKSDKEYDHIKYFTQISNQDLDLGNYSKLGKLTTLSEDGCRDIEKLSGEKCYQQRPINYTLEDSDKKIAEDIKSNLQYPDVSISIESKDGETSFHWSASPFYSVPLNKELPGVMCAIKNGEGVCEGSFLTEEGFSKFKAFFQSFSKTMFKGFPEEVNQAIDQAWLKSKESTESQNTKVSQKYQSIEWVIEVNHLEESEYFNVDNFPSRNKTIRISFKKQIF